MDAFHPDAFPGLAKILFPLLSRDYGYYIEETNFFCSLDEIREMVEDIRDYYYF